MNISPLDTDPIKFISSPLTVNVGSNSDKEKQGCVYVFLKIKKNFACFSIT